ncbi:MAG: PhnD/SsuA/transferrin family substrate-binding protein [Pseudomonadota bacterium]
MLASFPWYDLPSVRWANDRLWDAMALPGEFVRNLTAEEMWTSDRLGLTQACGLDLYLSGAPIEPVAAPVFDLDCDAGRYYSHIIGNRHGRLAAVNALSSRSGLSALLSMCEPTALVLTGSHLASIEMVRSGAADVAAIYAVTWRIIERDAPQRVRGVNIVARSATAPSPPFVGKRGELNQSLFLALADALASPETIESRRALCLRGVQPVERHHYDEVVAEYKSIAKRTPDLLSAQPARNAEG